MSTIHTTREAWLLALLAAMRPAFSARGLTIPATIRVSCGWPSSGGLSRKGGSRTIGQCFDPTCSADHHSEVFVSPVLDVPLRVADVLAHELAHAAVGIAAKHGPKFAKAATALGLTGKPTATVAGPDFLSWAAPLVESLGAYPHSSVDLLKSPRKVQGTRMVKMACHECGYVARTTRKWLDAVGTLMCPCTVDGLRMVEEGGE